MAAKAAHEKAKKAAEEEASKSAEEAAKATSEAAATEEAAGKADAAAKEAADNLKDVVVPSSKGVGQVIPRESESDMPSPPRKVGEMPMP